MKKNRKLIELINLLLGTNWDCELADNLRDYHLEVLTMKEQILAKLEAVESAVKSAVSVEAEQIKAAIEKAKSTGSEADFQAITAKVDSLQSRLVNAVSGLVEDEDEAEPTEDPEVGVFPVL